MYTNVVRNRGEKRRESSKSPCKAKLLHGIGQPVQCLSLVFGVLLCEGQRDHLDSNSERTECCQTLLIVTKRNTTGMLAHKRQTSSMSNLLPASMHVGLELQKYEHCCWQRSPYPFRKKEKEKKYRTVPPRPDSEC